MDNISLYREKSLNGVYTFHKNFRPKYELSGSEFYSIFDVGISQHQNWES